MAVWTEWHAMGANQVFDSTCQNWTATERWLADAKHDLLASLKRCSLGRYPRTLWPTSNCLQAVFVNGGMTEPFWGFLMLWTKMPTTKTSVSTVLPSKCIRTVWVQKRGCKFRIEPVYWDKPWWKNHKNSRCCRCLGKSRPVSFDWRAGS